MAYLCLSHEQIELDDDEKLGFKFFLSISGTSNRDYEIKLRKDLKNYEDDYVLVFNLNNEREVVFLSKLAKYFENRKEKIEI